MKPQQDLFIHRPKKITIQTEPIEQRTKDLTRKDFTSSFSKEAISQVGFISGLDNELEKPLGSAAF